jgi:hypothetical protein
MPPNKMTKRLKIDSKWTQNERKWKKAEFVANQAKAFFADNRVERVIFMLDWSSRIFEIDGLEKGKIMFIHDQSSKSDASENDHINRRYIITEKYVILSESLRDHTSQSGKYRFAEVERFVRDEVDWFLFKLGIFGQLIQSGIISYEEIDGLLDGKVLEKAVFEDMERLTQAIRCSITNHNRFIRFDFLLPPFRPQSQILVGN